MKTIFQNGKCSVIIVRNFGIHLRISFDCIFYRDTSISTPVSIDIVLQKYNTATTFWDNIDIQTLSFAILNVNEEQISVSFSAVDNTNSITPAPNDKTPNKNLVLFGLALIKLAILVFNDIGPLLC